MGFAIGAAALKGAAWGDTPLKGVALGATQIWSAVPPFEPSLVTVTAVGAYSVPWPAGATKVDRVLCGGGGGGGAFSTAGIPGYSTVCGSLSAPGGAAHADGPAQGGSPGDEVYNGQTYLGGAGGGPGFYSPGTQPGGGGGGSGGGGGDAGTWVADTVTKQEVPGNLTGSVGSGGPGAVSSPGGDGIAHFYFHT